MTLRQEAYEKMAGLSDNNLRLVIALLNEMRRQANLPLNVQEGRY